MSLAVPLVVMLTDRLHLYVKRSASHCLRGLGFYPSTEVSTMDMSCTTVPSRCPPLNCQTLGLNPWANPDGAVAAGRGRYPASPNGLLRTLPVRAVAPMLSGGGILMLNSADNRAPLTTSAARFRGRR